MTERPILCCGSMVRAIIEDRKTQTRRAFSPYILNQMKAAIQCGEVNDFLGAGALRPGDLEYIADFCPYGHVGDRLWVKETFFDCTKFKNAPAFAAVKNPLIYRADYEYLEPGRKVIGCHRWKPSIFMPRSASRLLLEIVGVRVERLNVITEADAIAEGIDVFENGAGFIVKPGGPWQRNPEDAYRNLWESINGEGSWALNPWVWVIVFKKVEGSL